MQKTPLQLTTSMNVVSHRLLGYMPWLLALFFALWGLRGVANTDIVETDAVRHAMNGAFIYDLLRSGKFTSPVEYGEFYYTQFPALSLPYHPPLFPVVEALFYWGLGVTQFAARLAVAVATAISVLLFYRLLITMHGSNIVAGAATVTFFSMKLSQYLANEVMLEFPALALGLGALYYLRSLNQDYSLRDGLAFALLAGAAVWTKQHAVFLGFVPFFCIIYSGNWRLLTNKAIWISALLFGIIIITLLALSFPFDSTGALQSLMLYRFSGGAAVGTAASYMQKYLNGILDQIGFFPIIMAAIITVLAFWRGKDNISLRPVILYLAWISAAFLTLLLTWQVSNRYLFFVDPPLIALGYVILFRCCSSLLPRFALAKFLPLFIAGAYCIFHLNIPPAFLQGPSQAAEHIVDGSSTRVLYCGQTDGNFIFAVRCRDPQIKTTVIRGEKLPTSTFQPDAIEDFAHRYGIKYIVLESTERHGPMLSDDLTKAWNQLRHSPTMSMVLERTIPLVSSTSFFNGSLYVYRFTNPSANPESVLNVPMNLIGKNFNLRL